MDFVGGVGIPDNEFSILRGRDQMPSVGGPVHSVDLREMAFEIPPWLHAYARERLGIVEGNLSHCPARAISHAQEVIVDCANYNQGAFIHLQLVSARSSFFRLMRSLRPSASLLAAVILACICSPVKSFDMVPTEVRCGPRYLGYSQALRDCDVGDMKNCAARCALGVVWKRDQEFAQRRELQRRGGGIGRQ